MAMFFDTKEPYDYMRIDRHEDFDYVIFGGEDHKTGQVEAEDNCFNNLLLRLRSILPDAQIENRWSGQVIETNDGFPLSAKMPSDNSSLPDFVATVSPLALSPP